MARIPSRERSSRPGCAKERARRSTDNRSAMPVASCGHTKFSMPPRAWFASSPQRARTSELRQLGERRQDPYLTRTEFDDQGSIVLDADDPAKAVLIVGHLVLHGKLLNRRIRRIGVEGTCGQEAPGRGA